MRMCSIFIQLYVGSGISIVAPFLVARTDLGMHSLFSSNIKCMYGTWGGKYGYLGEVTYNIETAQCIGIEAICYVNR